MKKFILSVLCCIVYLPGMAQSFNADSVNRTVFLFTEFLPGEVRFSDGTKQRALLNYNVLFQQMVFQQNGNMAALENIQTIDTVYTGNRKFVPVDTVFYELTVMPKRSPLYIRHTCTVNKAAPATPYGGSSQTGAVQNISSFRFGVATPYQLNVPDNYEVDRKAAFLVRYSGVFIHIKSFKQIKALFTRKEAAIKVFMKQNDINFSRQHDIEKLLEFCGQP